MKGFSIGTNEIWFVGQMKCQLVQKQSTVAMTLDMLDKQKIVILSYLGISVQMDSVIVTNVYITKMRKM